MKRLILICCTLFLAYGAGAQAEYNHIVAKVLMSGPVQNVFVGKSAYVILANEVVNDENCTPSMLRLDRPVRFLKQTDQNLDGPGMIEPRDCIAFLTIEILDRGGYKALVQDLNTGRNVFVQKY